MDHDERYVELSAPGEFRARGTRVGVEQVVSAYLAGALPEEICLEFPAVTLEQVHGVLAWYLRNKKEVDLHLADWRRESRRVRRRQDGQQDPAVVQRLRQLLEARVRQ